jgi:GT2 family glycosyltransferase
VNELSVITIVRDRPGHLARLIHGLAQSALLPAELIVVDMSEKPCGLPNLEFPVRHIRYAVDGLALAAARNVGARIAFGQRLLFLDVDCIPRGNLVGSMNAALEQLDALVCSEVRYLGSDGANLISDEALERHSQRHPVRKFPEEGSRVELNAGLFWSLTFGIRHDRFDALQGFDEGYCGYGAEDTDFGFRARESGLPLVFLGGTGSYHQYHGVISPPLHHLADIVRNANRFYARWGTWPMQGWLEQFVRLGLVTFSAHELQLVREATLTEINSATQPTSVVY